MRTRLGWSAFWAAAVLLPSAGAAAQELAGTTLRIAGAEGEQVLELGCAGTQVHLAGDRAFVACGEAGVALVDLGAAPRVLHLPQPGRVEGLFLAEGSVWARLADGSARPVASLPASPEPAPVAPPASVVLAPPAPPPPPPPPAFGSSPPLVVWPPEPLGHRGALVPFERVAGRVVAADRDRADVVFERPVERGTVVELVRAGAADPGGMAEERAFARGIVEAVDERLRASVLLETNASVEEGTRVRTTSRRGGTWMMPPLALGTAQIAASFRAYLPLDTLAVGMSGDLTLGYLVNLGGELGLRLSANLTNLGGVVGGNTDEFAALGHGYVSFAMRFFEVGIGLGASSLSLSTGWGAARVGFSFGQLLRFGNEDGLSLRLASSVVVAPGPLGAGDRWEFGDLHADGRIPLGHGVWLRLTGGGGNSGLFHGDVGARVRLRGNGLGQSLFLSAGIGLGYVAIRSFAQGGPLFSVGLEYRM